MSGCLKNEDVQYNNRDVNRALRKNEAVERLSDIRKGRRGEGELYLDPRYELDSIRD